MMIKIHGTSEIHFELPKRLNIGFMLTIYDKTGHSFKWTHMWGYVSDYENLDVATYKMENYKLIICNYRMDTYLSPDDAYNEQFFEDQVCYQRLVIPLEKFAELALMKIGRASCRERV